MATKKEKPNAAAQSLVPELDKDSRKRLDKLSEDWDKVGGAFNFLAGDIRLLLEHYQPLRNLIRDIAQNRQADAPLPPEGPTETAPQHAQPMQDEAAAQTAEQAKEAAEALAQMQTQVQTLSEQCLALKDDLDQCSATAEKLLQEKKEAQQALRLLEKQLQQAQKELTASRNELDRMGSTAAEVRLLQTDATLARRLDLADLPDDATQALVRLVAVLAQRDNLERLWTALKERCETENRPAKEEESALLAAALTWYNHNWRSKPYQLVTAPPNMAYNFECHLRSQHSSAGEKITDLRLPGIADGSGRLLCKALVSTH